MDIIAALEYVHSIKPSLGSKRLEPMKALLSALGNPEKNYRILHVAGTNGKGSVCAYTARILMSAGQKIGLFTSPYLMCFNERIRINDAEIPDKKLAALIAKVKSVLDAQPGWVRDGVTQFGF
ncbi:MAG TPA: bifunctional folylpolyglutamate synthase/dihydrofolate synthase, partial [Clostridia bacterium]|nr:bifunctional folylpolyglutamate synthase/dihydrofolate synthase [Clostridia bacterium]